MSVVSQYGTLDITVLISSFFLYGSGGLATYFLNLFQDLYQSHLFPSLLLIVELEHHSAQAISTSVYHSFLIQIALSTSIYLYFLDDFKLFFGGDHK
jgi:hypothetical protein